MVKHVKGVPILLDENTTYKLTAEFMLASIITPAEFCFSSGNIYAMSMLFMLSNVYTGDLLISKRRMDKAIRAVLFRPQQDCSPWPPHLHTQHLTSDS